MVLNPYPMKNGGESAILYSLSSYLLILMYD